MNVEFRVTVELLNSDTVTEPIAREEFLGDSDSIGTLMADVEQGCEDILAEHAPDDDDDDDTPAPWTRDSKEIYVGMKVHATEYPGPWEVVAIIPDGTYRVQIEDRFEGGRGDPMRKWVAPRALTVRV